MAFEPSDLLTCSGVVFKAPALPSSHFAVVDATGVEIGRVVEEVIHEHGSKEWLVVYDRKHRRVLAVEKGKYSAEGHRKNPFAVIDGSGHPVASGLDWRGWFKDASGQRICAFKLGPGLSPFSYTIKDSTKAEVGTITVGVGGQDGDQIGVTLAVALTGQVPSELRLAILGYAASLAEQMARSTPAWILKRVAKTGVLRAGSAGGPESH